ncbi:amino acid ABC transporter substrate-binding protein (plasmid) [Gemmobacter aquarius]|uniref:Amino acid ABC transporter substrate-binding protein n=2 Tax=Paragemmobacter aquarius TaxID=2169400 RepID=A0A2S0US87_9RHOB|nr:amino acid ABC transporter substrate-binding protein [Gemmobacter aquarius]
MIFKSSMRAFVAVAIATVSFGLSPASAQVVASGAAPLPLAPDVAAIVDRGTLIVAMTSFDNPPFYSGSGKHLEGIDVTLAERVAEALGVKVEFNRDAETFNDVVAKVALGQADLAISKISRTHARAQVVAFSEPYARLRHALIFNRLKLARMTEGRDIAEVVRHFEGSIGVIENSSFATFAKERFPHATVVPFKTWDEVIEATIAGKVDASYRDEFEIRKVAVDRPDASISLRTVTINDARDSIAVAAPWDRPRLLGIVNQVIDERATQVTADELIALYRASTETEGGH